MPSSSDYCPFNVQLDQAGSYVVSLHNDYGSVMSIPAQLTVRAPEAPLVVTPLVNQTATNGDTVTFVVNVTGSEPLAYQWFFDQTNKLDGETNNTLLLANVTPLSAGTYRVDIDNLYGHTSSSANLQVRVLPAGHIRASPASHIRVDPARPLLHASHARLLHALTDI